MSHLHTHHAYGAGQYMYYHCTINVANQLATE